MTSEDTILVPEGAVGKVLAQYLGRHRKEFL